MEKNKNKQPVFDARGRWVISFYDWFILGVSLILFSQMIEFSWWYLGFYIVWERPYIVLGDSVYNLSRNIATNRLEKKLVQELLKQKEEKEHDEDIQNNTK